MNGVGPVEGNVQQSISSWERNSSETTACKGFRQTMQTQLIGIISGAETRTQGTTNRPANRKRTEVQMQLQKGFVIRTVRMFVSPQIIKKTPPF